MLIRISLLSLLALAACSDDPKAQEPVAAEAPSEPAQAGVAANAPSAAVSAPTVVALPVAAANPANMLPPAKVLSENTFWVFVAGANIRSAPSLSAKIVGTLTWGEKLTALGSQQGFIKIAEGQFVHRKMLTDRKSRFGAAKAAH